MGMMTTIRIFLAGVCLLFITLLTACNMPVSGRYPDSLSKDELHQTISAQLQFTSIPGLSEPDALSTQAAKTAVSAAASTVSPINGQKSTPSALNTGNPGDTYTYLARSGDTLEALATRFNVAPQQISSPNPIPPQTLIPAGQQLEIPIAFSSQLPADLLLPDSEVINSPSAVDFDIKAYINDSGGFLKSYEEIVDGQMVSAAQIIERVSEEASVSPRILLAFLEYRSGWVTQQTVDPKSINYPIGFRVPGYKGLYLELVLTGTHLNAGYYGWRSALKTSLKFPDGSTARMSPTINAGTAGVQNLFSKFYSKSRWFDVLYSPGSFIETYITMFGDPWERAARVEPIFPAGLSQPFLELPFSPGEHWSLTGGPHYSWNTGSPRGALDFAPVTGEPACAVSRAWVTASAPGTIVRSAHNVVVIDLDSDGHEQTGWAIVYLHIADEERISTGSHVEVDTPIGHPSCERGRNTGTHVHIARKYNGEWLFADERLPCILSGWTVEVDERNYQGKLMKDGLTVSASPVGNSTSTIMR